MIKRIPFSLKLLIWYLDWNPSDPFRHVFPLDLILRCQRLQTGQITRIQMTFRKSKKNWNVAKSDFFLFFSFVLTSDFSFWYQIIVLLFCIAVESCFDRFQSICFSAYCKSDIMTMFIFKCSKVVPPLINLIKLPSKSWNLQKRPLETLTDQNLWSDFSCGVILQKIDIGSACLQTPLTGSAWSRSRTPDSEASYWVNEE